MNFLERREKRMTEIDRETFKSKDWIEVRSKEDKLSFGFRLKNESWHEILDPTEDFISEFFHVLALMNGCKLKGFFLPEPDVMSQDTFTMLRELVSTTGNKMIAWLKSPAPKGQGRLIDLISSRMTLKQWNYRLGSLDGKRIPKYLWFDDKFFHSVKVSASKFEIYGKRCIDDEAELVFMGELDVSPTGYDYGRPVDADKVGEKRLQSYLEGLSEQSRSGARFQLASVRHYGTNFQFLVHAQLTPIDSLYQFIQRATLIGEEDRMGIRNGANFKTLMCLLQTADEKEQ